MSKTPDSGKTEDDEPSTVEQYLVKDPERFALNMARMIEQAGKAASAWAEPRERGEVRDHVAEPVVDMVKTFSKLSEYWLADPQRALEAQTRLFAGYMTVWANAIQRVSPNAEGPDDAVKPERGDKRFQDPEWGRNAFFDFLKQAYLVTSRWASELVEHAEGLDEHTRHKASFYVKQVSNAISPSNFILTNPELFRETVASNGENLVRGMKMLAEDIAAGKGDLKLRQADYSPFEIGRNIATTTGKVVGRSDVAEIIQYDPATETVLKRPLLICPPWINKFYILDLNPQKSFIRWAIEQGHTVFVISWINPDERHGAKGWEAYIREGLQYGLDTIEEATGERDVNAIGYCVGGTLLAAALALMAQEGDDRIKSATFFTTQVDFTYAGDLKVFVDEEQVAAVEKSMNEKGYLDGTKMATAFNMLRSGDLIWPYVVNNYMRGKDPLPFDLLYWNADSTRMAAANHSFYLRNCYLENNLSRGKMELAGHTVSLGDITIPIYNLASREDHIAPALSVFLGSKYFGGKVDYVMAGSGHIAGVVNPPASGKYQYWTGGKPEGDFGQWIARAAEHPGSWWPHWQSWIEAKDDTRVPARKPGKHMKTLGDAPGSYVKVRV
ncbi:MULTISPECIES: class I poly(R)-hydroxyalkanoic acid synthase [unclassified Mesorhizobium]|uniref:class I poly(R)-hydroxyalkanoic acid synthase n=1 Tax=unclassified Mesorhizobium TaxID=325217 RepID=UPI000BB0A11C|nr:MULTISPECIES: class I poly(R)-hydroxyalkanoic acid synthase [unclassified Mesorhizobium]PBB25639.1 class I poly(R)-hydroxyalkanoic acid synthase [Mesorhizobium sp. WSM4304]PBB72095.1 class I poly(R)-hydroxyalkanoic acid synthase [Mesorhizobium sp. WSM4308]PBC24894.1 class I poly(R)-hydroxyalkanoic acid synthase [Mesorhizobium sp. WSM4311]TRC89158.1 class I poly(R)-hydroxyalkanoic acid synthase [Mesorhizobium sp. WSM4310]TRD02920.1 class I poly(R)-hydroxyalkanoic acid synthase [Mesorhizobium